MAEEQTPEDMVIMIRGYPFPRAAWFSPKNLEDAMDYVPKDGDVIIASYPKTGTTWMQYIVLQIVSKGESFPSFDDVLLKYVPYLEMSGIAALEALQTKPRIYKHHIAYNMVQKNSKSKCIYVYRHPEDTVVSFYHFMKNLKMWPHDGEFDQFFDRFLTGNVPYGNYNEHVLSFCEHHEDDDLLLVSYEKLHSNKREEFLRIAKFLGEEYYQRLKEDEAVFTKVIEHTSFDYMKKNLSLTDPNLLVEGSDNVPSNAPKVNFFRKGIVGDGKNVLTEEQREKLRKCAEKVLRGTSVINQWYPK